jgi:molybdate transport system substrate-binding protein
VSKPILCALLLVGCFRVHAESATVAAAANFAAPLERLKTSFEHGAPHHLVLVTGSTGQLYAQIANGAPFDALLAADREHPQRLVAAGFADGRTRFTYAVGKLALWTRETRRAPLELAALGRGDYRWLAIANPDLAPYGLAAEQTLRALGLWETLQGRIVRGQSIAQAFAMAATGNAELALIALSQAKAYTEPASYVEVSPDLYEPIYQDAVLLEHGAGNSAAVAFLEYLRGEHAARVLAEFGYGTAGGR